MKPGGPVLQHHVSTTVDRRVLRRGFGVLWIAVKGEPYVFALAVGSSALYAAMTVLTATIIGRLVQHTVLPAFASGETTTGALVSATLLIVGVALLKAIGIVGRRLGAGLMQYRLQATYRRRVTRQYLRLPIAWHAKHPTGQLLSNANADVEAAWYPIAPLPFAVGVIVMLVVATASLIIADPVLALVGLAVFPLVAVLNVVYQRKLSPVATHAQQLRAEVSEVAHESFDGALVVKTLGREADETARFSARASELRDALIAVGKVRGLFDPVLEALPNLGVLAVLLVGSERVASGAITTGTLVEVAYLFTLLAFPLRAIGWVLGEMPRSVVGYDRVAAVLAATGELPYGEAASGREGAAGLELREVRFGYGDGRDVLREVSFALAPGRTVAIVGSTGAGKSTLTSLLVRLVDPATGEVLLDGTDVRGLARGELAASAALVPQQAFLFDDTVRGNLTLGADFPDEQVWAALRLAQAEGFVAALPDGLDTRVGERGTTLSGGQRQRLALARALVRRPRLLVMDDATSAVDPHVEQAILTSLREADLTSTVVVVAYRQATIALADEVVWLEDGRVAARGNHTELLAAVPAYADLVLAYARAETDRQDAETERDERDRVAAGEKS